MAHRIHWLLSKRVIAVTLSGGIMAEEVQRISDTLYDAVSAHASTEIVHMIVDAREASIQDRIWNYAKIHMQRHPSNGWTIVIGDSRLLGLVVAIFSKVLNTHIHYGATPEAAINMLVERDSSIAQYVKEHREPATTAKTR